MTTALSYDDAQLQLQQQHHRGQILQRILFCPAEERTARELHAMDKAQRQQVWADMAGHAATVDYRMHAESPELIRHSLSQLEEELMAAVLENKKNDGGGGGGDEPNSNSHPTAFSAASMVASMAGGGRSNHVMDGRDSYQKAVQQNKGWVDSQKLKFLRSEDFVPAAAAARMIRHFALKEYLFGSEGGVLGRDVTFDDLSADDIESLEAGGMQFLSQRDHAGRGIIFTRALNYKYKVRENQLRAIFYMSQIATRDERSQKVGYVSVSYNAVGGYPAGGYDFELTRRVGELVKACPVRFCAIYVCFSSSAWKPVAELIGHLVSPLLRVRLRTIQGSHQECLYQLYALGIPIKAIPLTNQGENRLDQHRAMLIQQR